MAKLKPKEKPHYVNNRDFSEAVYDYAKSALQARTDDIALPIVSNYIATCFIKIAEGLSHRPNFVRYTYREEMVMDAVENCLRAIGNYNIEAATRTGKPNAFSYFTQICYFAFIRRITKEKKQQDIKFRYIEKCGIEDFVSMGMDGEGAEQTMQYVDTLRNRIDQVKTKDAKIKDFAKEEKLKAKDKLELFMV
tara:strand:+ start:4971 stop:5549 length:579 start_codon:yes stop_codon:yes gene_type:complete